MKGSEILTIAKTLRGRKYTLGAFVPKNDKDYSGNFDCAEFVAYCIFQSYGFLYGCDKHDVKDAAKADAYTGYFDVDATKKGKIISIAEAIKTPGALALRLPKSNAIGHIVISDGFGGTEEANSTKYGCGHFGFEGRRFDYGILLPGVDYSQQSKPLYTPPAKVFRLTSPMMKDLFIGKIQKALGVYVDNIFGTTTERAVVQYQKSKGLIVDGEIMPGGQTATSLNII